MRERDRYRRLLQRLIRLGQQAKCEGVVAEALLPSGEEWLAAEAIGLSALTYAVAIELALAQWSNDLPVLIDEGFDATVSSAQIDPFQANDLRMDAVVRVLLGMAASLARAPALQPKVSRQTMTRLRRDLPEEIYDIVISWVQEAYSVLTDTRHLTPGTD
jgi:hypothetical protein